MEVIKKPRKKRAVYDTTVNFNEDKESRDARILLSLLNHRFLTRELISALVEPGWDVRTANARLSKLVKGGFLAIPKPSQHRYVEGGGAYPRVYMVGRKGIDKLHTIFGIPREHLTHINKNEDLTSVSNINHRLATSQYMVAIKVACDKYGYELIDESEIIRNKSTDEHRLQRRSRGWYVPNCNMRIEPDRLFQIRIPHLPEGKDHITFVLEIDLATETLKPEDKKKTSTIISKYERYLETMRDDILPAHFEGFSKEFVTLFVTLKKGRMFNMLKLNQEINQGSNRFWFSNFKDTTEDAFTSPFFLGKSGKAITILSVLETKK